MLKKADLEEIAAAVAQETRLTILNLLHQKNPATPFDPLRLVDLETRLRDLVFDSLCHRFLQEALLPETFLTELSLAIQDSLDRTTEGGDRP